MNVTMFSCVAVGGHANGKVRAPDLLAWPSRRVAPAGRDVRRQHIDHGHVGDDPALGVGDAQRVAEAANGGVFGGGRRCGNDAGERDDGEQSG
jgi:hypothetical protein